MTFQKGYKRKDYVHKFKPINKGHSCHIYLKDYQFKWVLEKKIKMATYIKKKIDEDITKELLNNSYLREILLSEMAKDTV